MIRATLLWSVLLLSQANANYFNYERWSRMTPDSRQLYIAGAFDSMVSFSANDIESRINRHYDSCISRLKMTNMSLANNLLDYVNENPDLRGGSVQTAMIKYLIELCGRP